MLKFVSNLVDLLKKGIFFQLFQIKIVFLPVWFPHVLLSCVKSCVFNMDATYFIFLNLVNINRLQPLRKCLV